MPVSKLPEQHPLCNAREPYDPKPGDVVMFPGAPDRRNRNASYGISRVGDSPVGEYARIGWHEGRKRQMQFADILLADLRAISMEPAFFNWSEELRHEWWGSEDPRRLPGQ